MGFRKLQVTGGGTYTVSLPKNWIQENSLDKGDQVSLSVKEDGSILISPKKYEENKETKIRMNKDLELVIRMFITKYLEGFDEIEIFTDGRFTPEFRRDLKETVQNLIGVELFEETSKKMVFQTLVKSGSLDLNNMLHRLSVITQSIYRDSINLLSEDVSDMDIDSRDDEVDKLHFYIRREINEALTNHNVFESIGMGDKTDAVNYVLISKNFERIADYAVDISNLVPQLESKPPKSLLNYADESIKVYKKCTEAFFKRDIEKASEMLDRYTSYRKSTNEILKSLYQEENGKNLVLYTSILDGIRSVIRHSTNISRVTINITG